MPKKVKEFRIQRRDIKWGAGQGYYPLAKDMGEAKKMVAKELGTTPEMLSGMKWKEGTSFYDLKLTKEARKQMKL